MEMVLDAPFLAGATGSLRERIARGLAEGPAAVSDFGGTRRAAAVERGRPRRPAWRFLRLDGARKLISVDTEVYSIVETGRLLGLLCQIVDQTLAAMPELAAEL